jgi:cyclase
VAALLAALSGGTAFAQSTDVRFEWSEDDSPRHQVLLRSLASFGSRWEADAMIHALGSSDEHRIAAYARVDARAGCTVSDQLKISVAGWTSSTRVRFRFARRATAFRDQVVQGHKVQICASVRSCWRWRGSWNRLRPALSWCRLGREMPMPAPPRLTRRAVLRSTGALAGAAIVHRYLPPLRAQAPATASAKAGVDALNARRAEMAKIPIARTRLTERLELLAGPGGNVLVLHGPDGLLLVDNFVKPAWPQLKSTLEAFGRPIATALDTHWHFDHADNNASLHRAGAAIVAHTNTKVRLAQSHDIIGLHIDPEPPEALPTVTFADTHALRANGEEIALQHMAPAHTDTDITVRFAKANVLHLGDLFFNGSYPFIDSATGGRMDGMVAAAEQAVKAVDAETRIVPGHGPLGDRAALEGYRTMLATIRDRVGDRLARGLEPADAQAAKPTASFDADWGGGFMKPDAFVALVYSTL